MIAAALAASLALTPVQWFGPPPDNGGRIGDYIEEVVHAKGMNPISTVCKSACTILFGSSHHCILPGTVAYFHPAHKSWDLEENPWKAMDRQGTLAMKTFYPRKLRAYTDAHHFWDDPDWKTLEYTQLVSLGVRPCR